MSYEVLARKWRPRAFESLIGQEQVVRALQNALKQQRLHHAWLFTGTRGVGKTTIARIMARCINCEQGIVPTPCGSCTACRGITEGNYPDLVEIDAASQTRVENMRELLENVGYAPALGRYKIYLIDEVHMLSKHSFNALLKTLEEPPEHVKFLLATTEPEKLPATVLSRCLQFHLRRVAPSTIAEYLGEALAREDITAEPAALQSLGEAAKGSVRDALSLTDQALGISGNNLTQEVVQEMVGVVDRDRVVRLLELLCDKDAPQLMAEVAALAELSPDYNQLLADLSDALHRISVCQVLNFEPDTERENDLQAEKLQQIARRLDPADVQLFHQFVLQGRRDFDLFPEPQSAVEMVLLRMLCFREWTGSTVVTEKDSSTEISAPAAASRPAKVTSGSEAPPPDPTPPMEPAVASRSAKAATGSAAPPPPSEPAVASRSAKAATGSAAPPPPSEPAVASRSAKAATGSAAPPPPPETTPPMEPAVASRSAKAATGSAAPPPLPDPTSPMEPAVASRSAKAASGSAAPPPPSDPTPPLEPAAASRSAKAATGSAAPPPPPETTPPMEPEPEPAAAPVTPADESNAHLEDEWAALCGKFPPRVAAAARECWPESRSGSNWSLVFDNRSEDLVALFKNYKGFKSDLQAALREIDSAATVKLRLGKPGNDTPAVRENKLQREKLQNHPGLRRLSERFDVEPNWDSVSPVTPKSSSRL